MKITCVRGKSIKSALKEKTSQMMNIPKMLDLYEQDLVTIKEVIVIESVHQNYVCVFNELS